MRRAQIIARDDQQTAAVLSQEDKIVELVAHATAVADELVEAGLPPYLALSQLTGCVATALHQHFGGQGRPE